MFVIEVDDMFGMIKFDKGGDIVDIGIGIATYFFLLLLLLNNK